MQGGLEHFRKGRMSVDYVLEILHRSLAADQGTDLLHDVGCVRAVEMAAEDTAFGVCAEGRLVFLDYLIFRGRLAFRDYLIFQSRRIFRCRSHYDFAEAVCLSYAGRTGALP